MIVNFTNVLFTKTIYCSLLSSGVLMSHSLWTNDDPETAKKKKSEATVVANSSLNNKSVKIYPDAFKREMHVLVKEKNEISFIVLNAADGTLLLNRTLKPGEHFKITGLDKGNYTYHVFERSEEKTCGKFEIR